MIAQTSHTTSDRACVWTLCAVPTGCLWALTRLALYRYNILNTEQHWPSCYRIGGVSPSESGLVVAYHKNFHPWRHDLAWAGLFFLSAVIAVRFAIVADPFYAVSAFGFVFATRLAFKSYESRTYGKRVERKALKALRKASPWSVADNVPVPGGGGWDIDAVVNGSRQFAVEIKSWAGLQMREGRLVRTSGRPPGGHDPINQCLRQAGSIDAVAVLWMPGAYRASAFHHRGVLVVNGPAHFLVDQLSAALG